MADGHAPEPPRAQAQAHAPEPPRAQLPPPPNPNVAAPPSLHPDERVFMRGPDGSRIVVTAKEVGRYGRMGFQVESMEATKAGALEEMYNTTGNQFLAGAEGAASALTLSGSDIALSFLDPEGAAQRAEQFGTERAVGSVVGGLLSLKAPLMPGGLAVRAGQGVGARIAGTRAAQGVIGRALPAIGANVTEGVIFGAAEGAGQTFLSDKPINAEALGSNILTGALWGGAIGGGFGVGGHLIGESVDLGRKFLNKGISRIEAANAAPSADLVRAGQRPPRLTTEVRGRAKVDLTAARTEQEGLIGAGRAAQQAAEGEGRSAAEALQWFRGDYDLLDQHSGSILRRIEKAGDNATPEMWAAHEALKNARGATRDVLEQGGVFKRSTALDDDLNLAPEKKVKRINDWGEDEALANSLRHPDLPNRIGAQEEALQRAKTLVDGPPEGRAAVKRTAKATAVDESTLPFHEQVERAAARVGDEGVFGDRKIFISDIYDQMPNAGMSLDQFKSALAKENQAGRLYLHRADLVQEMDPSRVARSRTSLPTSGPDDSGAFHFVEGNIGELRTKYPRASEAVGEAAEVAGTKSWQPFKVARDVFGKVSNYDDVMLRAAGGVDDPALAAVTERINQLEELLATGKPDAKSTAAFAKGGVEAAERAGIDVSWPTVARALEESGMDSAALAAASPEGKMLMQAQFARESAKRMLDARRGKAPPTLGQKMGRGIMASATGWAVGGHIGGLLAGVIGGGLLGRLVRGTSIGLTRKMAMSVGDAGKRMARGIDTFLGGAAKVARSPFVPRTAVQVLKGTAFGPDAGETKAKGSALQKAFHQRYNEMAQTAASPPETKRRINEALIGVRMSDPSMADQLGELIMRRIGYIYDTMPKAPYPQNPFTKTGWTPSDAEISKWTRCIEIAENPTAIFDHMEDGTLTPEHTHALKEVYPQIYGEIQMDIVSRAAEIKAELPWAKRVTLSTLFDAPTDDILRPENVFLIQEAYSEQDTEQADQSKPQLRSTSTHNPTKAQELAG